MINGDDVRKQALRAEYVGRINRVMDYIETHLDGDLSLATLAHVANFSEFHFHRIFKGEVGKNTLPAGKYAVGRFELLSHEFEEAWGGVMGGWLPQSGYQCDEGPCIEIYQNDPKQHPEGRCIVDICVPVKPL